LDYLSTALQVILAGGLINVWIFRKSKSTSFRGGSAQSLKEEFATYGLPDAVYYIVGFLKLGSALVLLAGIWIHGIQGYAAVVVAGLMVGALGMHLKVGDPMQKSLPALAMLAMSAGLAFLAFN